MGHVSRQSPHWLRPGTPCGSCRALRRCRSACSRRTAALTCSRRWRKARVPAGDLALISLPAAAAGDALRRDGLPGGNIRSDGLPLLQPLPLRWSGRPRGLRIDNIVHIVNTVVIRWSRLPGKLGCISFSARGHRRHCGRYSKKTPHYGAAAGTARRPRRHYGRSNEKTLTHVGTAAGTA